MSSEEVTTTNNSGQRITIDRPVKNTGKSKARVEAGKRLIEYNKKMRKIKESGETGEPVRPEESVRENNNDDDEMGKIILLLGAAGLGYHLYTTTINNVKEEVRKNVQHIQNNNDIQENTVSKLRSFNI